MSVTLNLVSEREGEIKRFLEKYYERETNIEEDVGTWIYIYHKPLEAIDLISTVIDNEHRYDISLWMQVGEEKIEKVTQENHNEIIKAILHVFYHECDVEYQHD